MIYPGNIVIKRLKHCFLISSVSLMIFMQNIQSVVFDLSKSMALQITEIAPSINEAVDAVETYNSWHNYFTDSWIGEALQIKHRNNTVLNTINVLEDEQTSIKLVRLLNLLGWGMLISNFILLVSLIHSLIWLFLDLRHRKNKGFTLGMIILSILFNFLIQNQVIRHINLI